MANVLLKPYAERDGNLVILADNTREIYLVDLETGEILEKGRYTGPSNNRDGTFRFSKPGSAYRNVGVMDENGNIILTVERADKRITFNYTDYNKLISQPPSTIPGYTFDNSQNIQATQNGQPNNADIANMSEEEYQVYQQQIQQPSLGEQALTVGAGLTGQSIGLTAADAALGKDVSLSGTLDKAITGSKGAGALAGVGTFVQNALSGDFDSRRGKGAVESTGEVAGATIGASLAGPVGGLLGKIVGGAVGRVVGSGLDKVGVIGGKSHVQAQNERFLNALQNAPTDEDKALIQQNIEAKERDRLARLHETEDRQSVFQSGFLKGRKWDLNDIKHTIVTGNQFAEPFTFVDVFPDWMSRFTPEERAKIVEYALDNDLVVVDHGQPVIKGKKKDELRQVADAIQQGQDIPTKTPEQRHQENLEYWKNVEEETGYHSSYLDTPYEDIITGKQPVETQPQVWQQKPIDEIARDIVKAESPTGKSEDTNYLGDFFRQAPVEVIAEATQKANELKSKRMELERQFEPRFKKASSAKEVNQLREELENQYNNIINGDQPTGQELDPNRIVAEDTQIQTDATGEVTLPSSGDNAQTTQAPPPPSTQEPAPSTEEAPDATEEGQAQEDGEGEGVTDFEVSEVSPFNAEKAIKQQLALQLLAENNAMANNLIGQAFSKPNQQNLGAQGFQNLREVFNG